MTDIHNSPGQHSCLEVMSLTLPLPPLMGQRSSTRHCQHQLVSMHDIHAHMQEWGWSYLDSNHTVCLAYCTLYSCTMATTPWQDSVRYVLCKVGKTRGCNPSLSSIPIYYRLKNCYILYNYIGDTKQEQIDTQTGYPPCPRQPICYHV